MRSSGRGETLSRRSWPIAITKNFSGSLNIVGEIWGRMSKLAWMLRGSHEVRLSGVVAIALAGVLAMGCGSPASTDQDGEVPGADASTVDGGGEAATSIEGGAATQDASIGPDADATTGDGAGGGDGGAPDGDDASAATEGGSCVPRSIDCTGLCGPVTDPCSGETKQCGGCAPATVCDLGGHTCVTPKTTCADLIPGPSRCGIIQNSCGDFLNCGNCPNGQECDPQSNTCVACIPVTCKDVGAQCGPVWNGCGDPNDPANRLQCPACPSGSVCNGTFNVCESACTPLSPAAACAAAKAATGVQCGIITDGCGGTVNCDLVSGFGCSNGQLCGAAGLDNHCDQANTPVDCKALGRTCGTVTSSCTGQQVSCGTCTKAGDVCNQNGVCGPPCTPNTCSSQAILAMNGGSVPECGTFPDGCGGTLGCGPCAAGSVCTGNSTCCKVTGICGLNQCGLVANGCGGQLDCSSNCAAGSTCDAVTGTCCTPKTCTQVAPSCGANLDNGCHGTMSCPTCAGAGNVCDAQTKTCCTPFTCAGHYPGMCGTFTDGCGGLVDCTKNCGAGQVCNPTAMTCCAPTACGAQCGTVSNGCGGTQSCGCPNGQVCDPQTTQCCTPIPHAVACNTPGQCGPVPNGCGDTEQCTCPSGGVCNGQTHQCCTPYTCAAHYAGMCGTFSDNCGGTVTCSPPNTCNSPPYGGKCDTGAYATPPFSDGCGGTLTCGCTGANTCGGGGVANVCGCTPLTCSAPSIAPKCGMFSNGCGGVLDCTGICGPGRVCNVSGSPPADTCCTPTTCNAILAGMPAGTCGTFSDGCGGSLNCTAVCGGGQVCNTSVNGMTGMPTDRCCTPLTCAAPQFAGKCGNFFDGCGGTLQCNNVNCGASQVCNPLNGTCCSPKTCATNYPGQCGNHDDGCGNPTGLSCNANCTGSQVCNPGNSQCCTPQTCAANHPNVCGNFPDACGGTLHCTCANSTAGPVCSTAAANLGTCCSPATCPPPAGGGGVPPGGVCGTIPDGCGGSASCSPCQQYPIPGIGSCGPTNTCTASANGSVCACTPLGCVDNCGNPRTGRGIPDGCGGTVNCGG